MVCYFNTRSFVTTLFTSMLGATHKPCTKRLLYPKSPTLTSDLLVLLITPF